MGHRAAELIDLAEYREKTRAGEVPTEAALRKQYIALVKAEGGRAYTWTISTGVIDRDRDRIDPEGWKYENFLAAGGPVLYAHRSSELPIGKSAWVRIQDGQLKARVEFAPADVYPFAETVRQLVDFGAIRSASVGFRPLPGRAAWNEERNGIDFLEQELLEWSIVPVPANPEALLDAKAAGIDVEPVRRWAEQVLEGLEPGGLWIPRRQAEAALKVLAHPTVAVPDFQAEAYVAVAKEALQKRGRVLSAANEERIRNARTGAEACLAALDEVLDSMPMDDDDKGPAERRLKLRAEEPRIPVTRDDVVAATVAAVQTLVGDHIRRHTGRLD